MLIEIVWRQITRKPKIAAYPFSYNGQQLLRPQDVHLQTVENTKLMPCMYDKATS